MPVTAPPPTPLLQHSAVTDATPCYPNASWVGRTVPCAPAEAVGDARGTSRPASSALAVAANWLAVYADLFKARLTCLVLLTTLVGFYVGLRGALDYRLLCHLLLGTALLASGASALNQLIERDLDGRMRRTQGRPLPARRLQPATVFWVGTICGVLGLAYLAVAVNVTTSLLGGLTIGSYLLVYTPLKRVTWLNTLVGAVPGALPPLLGWTAARGGLGEGGLALFAVQACWQVPHFMAIAWIYRDEYARAGFQMLPVVDPQGRRTGRLAVGFCLALLGASLLPVALHLAGTVYLFGALLLGLGFLWLAVQFARATKADAKPGAQWNASLPDRRAWALFYFSLVYLPLLLTLMVLDKVK
jgi:heme o synthase